MSKKLAVFSLVEYPSQGIIVTLLFNCYVIYWWLEVGKRIEILGQIRAEFLLGALLGILILLKGKNNIHTNQAKSNILHSIWAYFFTLLLSLLLSIDFSLSWNIFFNRILKLSMMTLFVNAFVCSPKELRYFLFSTFISFFKVGEEALYGKVTGGAVWQNQGIMRLHGTPGTMFGHPNGLSGKTVSIVPYLWTLFDVVKKQWKALIVIQLVFTVNIIVFTGSRTGYIASCLLLLAFWWSSKRKVVMSLALVFVILVTFFTVPQQYKERFMSSFEGKEAAGHSKVARLTLLKDSITVFTESPFGVGIGCFIVAQRRAGRREQGTHNLYTQILTEIGIQGFVAFFYFIGAVVNALLFVRARFERLMSLLAKVLEQHGRYSDGWLLVVSNEIRDIKMLLALSTGTLLLLFIRMILGVFGHDLYEIYWWVAAGIALSLLNILSTLELRVQEVLAMSGSSSDNDR